MRIIAGEQVIEGVEVYSERVWHEGAARPALRLALTGGVTSEQLEALTAGEVAVCDDVGEEQGVWSGYNVLVRHEVVLAQVADAERLAEERDAAIAQAETARAETAQARETVRAAVPLMADSAALINGVAALLDVWTPGVYSVGDVRVYAGAPYRCVQAHDATGNEGWTPDAVPALWMQYHGTSVSSARSWVQPAGAHDMYKAGEFMVWTDGAVYRCVSDTSYSPAECAQAWEVCAE